MTVVARGVGNPVSLARRIRDQAQILAPVPAEPKTMIEAVDRQLAPLRFRARLLTLFAAVALILATIGIYGVVSFTMQRRNREIGIRMALGADRGSVCLHMIRRGMTPILIGIGSGLVAAWALRRFLASLVDGVALQDPLTVFTVVLLLSLIATVANYLPARRAAQADPLKVLKAE
jgi:putative ABC transport system permease protein